MQQRQPGEGLQPDHPQLQLTYPKAATVRGYGVVVVVRLGGAPTARALGAALPSGFSLDFGDPPHEPRYSFMPSSKPGRFTIVGPDLEGQSDDLAALGRAIANHITLVVAEESPSVAFVHAGAVVIDGSCTLLPGRSGAGKTTATDALLRRGADHLSDEYAVVDDRCHVHPFPRDLVLDKHRSPRVRTVAELAEVTATEPVPARQIIFTTYEPNATWDPEPIAPGETVLRLLDQAVAARSRPEVVLPILRGLAAQAVAVTSPRGDADDFAAHVFDWVRQLGPTQSTG